ncbi:hypothetical protein ACJJTC_003728 [Scirpophaga incertulas]
MFEAFLSGLWASIGSAFGKLSGSEWMGGNSTMWITLVVVMVLANTWGSRHYMRSLDASNNSASPTIVSAATSYMLSGLIGVLLFHENASLRWWAGALLIIVGLVLVMRSRNNRSHHRSAAS